MPIAASPKPAHQPTATASHGHSNCEKSEARDREPRAQQLREERAEVDPHVEDGEPAVAPPVPLFVKLADHGGDIGLEEAVAGGNHAERDQQDHHVERAAIRVGLESAGRDMALRLPVGRDQVDRPVVIALDLQLLAVIDDIARLRALRAVDADFVSLAVDRGIGLRGLAAEAQEEIAERHDDRAELHRALRSQILVRQIAADQRREIDERGIAPVKPGRLPVPEQEMLGEVEGEERAHPVIAEPLPHLRGEKAGELARVAEPCLLRRRIDVGDIRLARAVRGRGFHHDSVCLSLRFRCGGN